LNRKTLVYYFDLITVLTKKEIKVRYKNSALGYVWSIANPLMYAIIFYFVFKIVMKFNIKEYSLFLISGLFPWQWISNSIIGGANSFIGNASLIKKVIFPRYFLPLAQVLNDAFHFIVSIPVIVIFLLFYHKMPSFNWLIYLPLMLIPTFLMVYGFSLLVASMNIFFRDFQYIISLIMTLLFYLTPVFYDISFVPEEYRGFVLINPFTPLITNWRELFMHNHIDLTNYALSFFYSLIVLTLGFIVYKKLQVRFAEVI